MAHKKGANAPKLLTEVELELMTLIWQRGEVTVKDVVAALPPERRLAYTSVATVMKILEQKDVLRCRKDSHAHVYAPCVSKEDYEATCLDHVVTRVFDGEPAALVRRLLDAKGLKADELESVAALLEALAAGKGDRS